MSLLTVCFILQGCFFLPKEKIEEKIALLPPPQDKLTYVEVFRGPIEQLKVKTATTASLEEEFLYFRQNGRVASVLVGYNQQVKRGEVLATLEEENLQFQLKKQELLLEIKKIQLEQARIEADFGKYTPGQLRIIEIEYELAELEYTELKKNFTDKTLRAPFDGIVTANKVKVSDPVIAYEDVIRVTNPYKLQLVILVQPSELEDIELGLPLELRLTGDNWIPGRIVHVPAYYDKLKDGSPDRRVLVELEDDTIPLSYGKTYSARIIIKSNPNALQVAKEGIRNYLGKFTARIKDPDTGAVREAELKLGIEGERTWEVLNGLKEGELVISR